MKKVYICGAHSTGKTTLFDHLRSRLIINDGNILYSEEVARMVLKDNNVTAETQRDLEVFKRINHLIMEKQCEREAQIKNSADGNGDNKLCLFDRGILDPVCYLRGSVGEKIANKAMQRTNVKKLVDGLKNPNESIVFVMKPYRKYLTNDNVRIDTFDFKDILSYDMQMRSLMRSLMIKFHYIEDDDLSARASFVTKAISKQWPDLSISLLA